MSNFYNINLKRFALQLLPTFWRRPLLAAFLYAITNPLSNLHARFMDFRSEANFRLNHNGQVSYLRAVLNDYFDTDARRISVGDTVVERSGTRAFQRECDRPMFIGLRGEQNRIIHRRGFDGVGGFDFWINIPADLENTIDINRLKAIVNNYKLASKRYAINYV